MNTPVDIQPALNPTVCIAGIARDETRFVDEWLLYHRHIGVDRVILYDDDPRLPLARLLEAHGSFVTVVPWHGRHAGLPGRNRQTKAYEHAVREHALDFDWVGFLDVDEFVVLRQHESLKAFLAGFGSFSAVSLTWHQFGHNGFFDDPEGLVTSQLTRRMREPGPMVKTFSRPSAIANIGSAHYCRLKEGHVRADANGRLSKEPYAGKTGAANINHYLCRSFSRWMARAGRGDVSIDIAEGVAPENLWRLDADMCLRKFVEEVAVDGNEMVDDHMLRFQKVLQEGLEDLKGAREAIAAMAP